MAENKSKTEHTSQKENIPYSEDRKTWHALLIYSAILIILLFSISVAFGNDSVVVAVDLTGSEKKTDYQGREEFQKNLKAVEDIILSLKAGSKFTVIGITEDCFARPVILVDKRIGNDPGFFHERLQKARHILLKDWQQVAKGISPDAPATDIYGALAYASQIFKYDQNTSKVLILLSDMRQYGSRFDLESPSIINESLIERTGKEGFIADLKGVKTYVLGVHTTGKSQMYWESLKKYWELYFKKSGADLKIISMERRIYYE